MLEERADEGKVEVVAGDDDGERQAEAVADYLQRDVVDVGAMAGEEDEGLVPRGGEASNVAEVVNLVGGDVDALVVGAGEELDDEEVGALTMISMSDWAVKCGGEGVDGDGWTVVGVGESL